MRRIAAGGPWEVIYGTNVRPRAEKWPEGCMVSGARRTTIRLYYVEVLRTPPERVGVMAASDRVSPGFWVVCPEGFWGPLAVDLPGLGRAVALFSFEEEALLYLGLGGWNEACGLRARRVSGAGLLKLLSGRWAGYRSVALDPIPELGAGTLLPLTNTSRERFVRFLRSAQERGGALPAAL